MNFKFILSIALFFLLSTSPAYAAQFWGRTFKVSKSSIRSDYSAVKSRLTKTQLREFGILEDINRLKQLNITEKITGVHTLTLRLILQVNDSGERWQTPLQTLRSRRGDCEDLALLRVELLRWTGIPSNNMAVFTGFTRGQGHAIASVGFNNGTWVLDNLRSSAYFSNQPKGFRPMLGLQPRGMWFFSLSK